jgi:hypothetical protein
LVRSNKKLPWAEKTLRIALGFVPVASIVSSPFFQVALVIRTVSEAGGVPGFTVTVVVRVTPNQLAVIVTGVGLLVGEVARLNVLVAALALTTTSCGTRAIAGLLLDSCTTAPCVIAAEKRTVPVAFWPPTIDVGTKETEDSDGPPGVAALTDKMWVRELLSGVAPMIWTNVGGAAALEVMVKLPVVCPAGMVIDTGTCAALGSPENRRTTVGAVSGNPRSTVPIVDSPARTASGLIDRDPMLPAAEAATPAHLSEQAEPFRTSHPHHSFLLRRAEPIHVHIVIRRCGRFGSAPSYVREPARTRTTSWAEPRSFANEPGMCPPPGRRPVNPA